MNHIIVTKHIQVLLTKNWKKYHKKTKKESVVNWEAEANATDIQQKKIAIETIKNPAKALLGGMSEEQAEKILKTVHKYTDKQILKLREVNKKKWKLITENIENVEYITEETKDGEKKLYY